MMKKALSILTTFYLLSISLSLAQGVEFYTNDDGDKHIWGEFPVHQLQEDTTYSTWFNKGYEKFSLEQKELEWTKKLQNKEVDIYLGTWCGDSQEWVPQFLKLWDELGLERDQLRFIALHSSDEKYKQGPNGEEKGLNIHRVPTFIFKEDGNEIGRIVESPSTDLLTDVAQIALGYPSAPNYKGASYFLDLFDKMTMDEVYEDIQNIYNTAYYKVGRSAELNTLGKVLKAGGKNKEASLVFQLNTYYHSSVWYTHNSYAELLTEMENYSEAVKAYEKVISIYPDNEKAKAELERIKPLALKQEEENESIEGAN